MGFVCKLTTHKFGTPYKSRILKICKWYHSTRWWPSLALKKRETLQNRMKWSHRKNMRELALGFLPIFVASLAHSCPVTLRRFLVVISFYLLVLKLGNVILKKKNWASGGSKTISLHSKKVRGKVKLWAFKRTPQHENPSRTLKATPLKTFSYEVIY